MRIARWSLVVLACFASALLGVWVGVAWLGERTPRAAHSPTSLTAAAGTVTPAVVAVRAYHRPQLAEALEGRQLTTGSAVIISPDGYLATNNHVVEGARSVRVVLQDRREYDAEVVGVDASTDLALLKVAADVLPTVTFGDSDSLRIGEWVLAIGNPFGLTSTVTTGIVSARGRSIDVLEADDRIESFIQTDAAVNPGSSGGALVNAAGELVGINTAIITNSGRHEGYSFAIPGNLARRVLDDLRQYGEVKRAVLGAWVQGLNHAQAQQLGLRSARGTLVTEITPGGPAALSGLAVGDVLRAINGVPINSSPELQEQLSRYRPGQRIRVTYLRDRKQHRATVVLRDKQNRRGLLVSDTSDDLLHRLGFELRGLTPREKEEYAGAGARVIAIFRNSPVAATGMETDFLVTGVNGVPVRSLTTFLSVINQEGPLLLRGRYPGREGEFYYSVQP